MNELTVKTTNFNNFIEPNSLLLKFYNFSFFIMFLQKAATKLGNYII